MNKAISPGFPQKNAVHLVNGMQAVLRRRGAWVRPYHSKSDFASKPNWPCLNQNWTANQVTKG